MQQELTSNVKKENTLKTQRNKKREKERKKDCVSSITL